MNIRRFAARNSRDALTLVRQALGVDAVVLSTKPCSEGVEVLAMAPEGMQAIERMVAPATPAATPSRNDASGAARPHSEAAPAGVAEDVAQLTMSTLSFQDYVRERMLRRRQAALAGQPDTLDAPSAAVTSPATSEARPAPRVQPPAARPAAPREPSVLREPPVLREEIELAASTAAQRTSESRWADAPMLAERSPAAQRRDQLDVMGELRAMKGLI